MKFRLFLAAMLFSNALFSCNGFSQFGGSRAGVEGNNAEDGRHANFPALAPEVAEAYITIEGKSETRIRPTQIRVVMAVSSVAETAQLCGQEINETIRKLRADWRKLGITDDRIVEDFIAIVPRFDWKSDLLEKREVLMQHKIGYRMQSNLHVAVANDEEADAALSRAFDAGVTDVIAFDYISSGLDAAKEQARASALKAAKAKSEVLLTGVIKGEPEIINVQEHTTVHYPESLYRSFTNVAEEEISTGWRDSLPRIFASRPKNTYYRGLTQDADVQPRELPMRSEISVVSTVRLYFASPAASKKLK